MRPMVSQPAARPPSEREVLASLKDRLLGAARYLMPHDVERDGDQYRLTLSVRVDADLLTRGPDPIDFGELIGGHSQRELRVAGFGVTAVRDKGDLDTPEEHAKPWRYYAPGDDGLYREISRSEDYDPPYRSGAQTGSPCIPDRDGHAAAP